MEITIKTPGGENIHPVLSVGVALCGETTASTEVLTRAAGQALGRARGALEELFGEPVTTSATGSKSLTASKRMVLRATCRLVIVLATISSV